MAIAWVSCLPVPGDKAEAGISLGNVSLGPGKVQVADKGRKGEEANVLFVPEASDAKTTAR